MQVFMAKTQVEFDWDDVRVFLALVREGTLAAAAAKLHVDATTVGRRLTSLERALRTTLFERGRDGVELTAAGEQLVALAEETERGAAGLFAAANSLETTVEGVVRLTTPPVMAEVLIVPLLPTLAQRHPNLHLEIDASIAYANLTRREADLALRLRRPESGDLLTTRLLETRYGLFGSPHLVERVGTLSNLDGLPFIGWTAELAAVPAAVWGGKYMSSSAFVLRSGGLTTQIAAARAGFGCVLLPTAVAQHFGLRPVPTQRDARRAVDAAPREHVWLVGHRALRNVPRIAAVWDLLVERFAALPKPRVDASRRAPA